ncbi:MAG: sigma 54-dependent Fis family transcriptional regulator [Deltaproteobacteria bacterium]|nr:sigma 54-dependent Fis family transcriptional regulator [Deltaproteobacteria bacterium]
MTTSPTRLVRRSDGAEVLLVRRYRLSVEKGPDRGATIELDRERASVGTTEGTTLRLSDTSVSRLHFEVVAHDQGFLVRDLGSTNGTTVEGLRVTEAFLPPTARIEAGQTLVRFEALSAESEVALPTGFGELVGKNPSMRRLFATLASVAATDTTVLVEGETGTGKELVARALHDSSPRSRGPLVVVDCGGLPGTLVEAELFGYERGAFTGAVTAKAGAFEAADGGTIFLDEVGEMPLELQPKLLRVLESRTVRRLGQAASQPRPIDVRVIAATNRDLRREVNRGAFRSDLFYRLAVVMIRVPALRERPDDIPVLVENMLSALAAKTGKRFQVSARTLARLERHGWPGNVRELRNFVERSTALAAGPHLGVTGLIDEARDEEELIGPPAAPPVDAAGSPVVETELPYKVAKQRWVDAFEARYLTALLERAEGNVARAAREAEIDRAYLFRLIKRYDIPTRPS